MIREGWEQVYSWYALLVFSMELMYWLDGSKFICSGTCVKRWKMRDLIAPNWQKRVKMRIIFASYVFNNLEQGFS